MKRIVFIISLLICRTAFGLSFATTNDLLSHISAPSTAYNFPVWDQCGHIYGAWGYRQDGSLFGSSNTPTVLWPVGPYAFVHAGHIENSGGIGPVTNIVFQGQSFNVDKRYELQSDIILLIVTNKLTNYNAVWPYYSETTNVTVTPNDHFVPGFGIIHFPPITNTTIVPVNISNKTVFGMSSGPFGQGICVSPGAPAMAWGVASNTYGATYNWHSMRMSYTNPAAYSYSPLRVFTPSIQIPYASPNATNFGAWTGDSGGGIFIYDNGQWWLAALMHAGGNCLGAEIMGAFIYNASVFNQEYWNIIGDPTGVTNGLALRSYFATNAAYSFCAGYPSLTNQPTPPTNPPPVVQPPDPPPQTNGPCPSVIVPTGDEAFIREALDILTAKVQLISEKLDRLIMSLEFPKTILPFRPQFATSNVTNGPLPTF